MKGVHQRMDHTWVRSPSSAVHVAPSTYASMLNGVLSRTLSLTWSPLAASLPTHSSSPLSVVGSAMLQPRHRPLFSFLFFFFCLIEIQLGTQTMPVSWHILGKGWIRTSIRLRPHIRPSTDHHGPMPTWKWVFFVVVFFFFYIYLMFCLLLTRWNEVFNSKPSCLRQPTVGDRVGNILIVVASS